MGLSKERWLGPEEYHHCLVQQLPQGRPLEFSQAIQGLSPGMGVQRLLPVGVVKQPSLGVGRLLILEVYSYFHW